MNPTVSMLMIHSNCYIKTQFQSLPTPPAEILFFYLKEIVVI